MKKRIFCSVSVAYAITVVIVLSAHSSDKPDHLEPITPYDHSFNDYHQLVFKSLIREWHPELWMIVTPSFRPEYSLLLRKVPDSGAAAGHYELEYSICEQMIWGWKDIGDAKSVLDLKHDVTVTRRTAEIPPESATGIIETWKAVIAQTRYAAKDWVGNDGVTYEFYATPDLFGQTWSPDSGTPKMMVDLGDQLIEYVTSSYDKRDSILKRVAKLTTELRAKVEPPKP